ncbi:glycosyltransferase [Pseudonocardia benzenivorans]
MHHARRAPAGLRDRGRRAWPRPGPGARTALASALAAIPAGTVVLLDGLVACGVPEVVVPHAARLRLVVLVHLPLGDEAGAAPGLAAAERRVLHAAAAVVTTSEWTAGRVVTGHGVPAARVHVAEPGADPAPLAAGSGDGGSLLCLGSVTPTKGQDVLVEALAAVADRPWTCRVGGTLDRAPAFARRVRERARLHGLADRVSFEGRSPVAPSTPRSTVPTCWCCRRGPRRSGWSCARRPPARSRCWPPTRGCR